MSKVVKFNPRGKKPPAARMPRRIGRDFFAVMVVGLGIAAGLAWTGIDASRARLVINDAAGRVQELASGLPSRMSDTSDQFPVSSIGDKPLPEVIRPKQRTFTGHYPVCGIDVATRDNCVIDGDTFYLGGTAIRISDIDAPETHPPRCAYEADLGDRATRRLSQLLGAGPFQLVRHDRDLDRYGRQLRIVIREGRSIGKMMVSEGLARPWTGKRRPWCGGSDNAAG